MTNPSNRLVTNQQAVRMEIFWRRWLEKAVKESNKIKGILEMREGKDDDWEDYVVLIQDLEPLSRVERWDFNVGPNLGIFLTRLLRDLELLDYPSEEFQMMISDLQAQISELTGEIPGDW
jgi:hypothetical protein